MKSEILQRRDIKLKDIPGKEKEIAEKEIDTYLKSLEKKMKFKISTSIKEFLIARR